jgi:hypothetical protein
MALQLKMRSLQSFAQKRVDGVGARPAWPDVPYHYYIDGLGRIAEGRDASYMGDSNTSYELDGHLQIALEGNFEQEIPTSEQLDALRELIVWLQLFWRLPAEGISTHQNHAATVCPGRNFLKALPDVLAKVKDQRASAIKSTCTAQPAKDASNFGCERQ